MFNRFHPAILLALTLLIAALSVGKAILFGAALYCFRSRVEWRPQ